MDDVKTTEDYWDCECENDYIHPKGVVWCNKCKAFAEDQPDSRVSEVLARLESL